MTEANAPVPQETLHPYDAGYRALRTDPPTASVLRCNECLESFPIQPERDADPELAEKRFLADHAYRHANPDHNNGYVEFTITRTRRVRSTEVAFPHRRPLPRPTAAAVPAAASPTN